ncbi:MAG: class I SAM-dependent methyltransferase [Candidatus Omnitrophica bacterium]|nr:class I SAM-dependent methyltransferase [Candidatus Omnitrophota bacterium]
MIEYDPEFAKMLDWEEIPMRREIIRWLGNLGFSNGTLYDPMCSTGGFLETVYSAFPEAQFYGSDISEPMVQYAQNNLAGKDNITIFQRDANGGLPDNIPNGTIDVLIFRGLNEVVLTRDIAKAIFTNHIPLLRKGSIVILSGMTDVILYSQFFRENGFRVLNMVNYSEEMIERVPRRKGFYQFYVLVYEGNED